MMTHILYGLPERTISGKKKRFVSLSNNNLKIEIYMPLGKDIKRGQGEKGCPLVPLSPFE